MSSQSKRVQVFAKHIWTHVTSHQSAFDGGATAPPLFVAMQGPQGCGKTTTCSLLKELLASAPYHLHVAVMSTDDLYHTHDNLVKVAQANPLNKLLVGRGQPGTHDIPLGREIFEALATINETKSPVKLPLFEKSLFAGEGDRLVDQFVTVSPPVDVFILEGWQMGFAAIGEDEIERQWQAAKEESPLKNYRLQDLLDINKNLTHYQREWYKYFTVFLQIRAKDLTDVYKWRTQQEREMKAKNGGIGMSDEQVKRFVDRYIPSYILFLETINTVDNWKGKGKTVLVGSERGVINEFDW